MGQTLARARVVHASIPGAPDSPEPTEISDTEVLLRWKQPKDDGHSPVVCYGLQVFINYFIARCFSDRGRAVDS